MRFSRSLFSLTITFGLTAQFAVAAETTTTRPNVLMIISDDLNDWIGPYKGHPQAKTPNLDKLAARGVTFRNNQCAAPLCNPSRTALMSGMRPSTTGIYHNHQPWMPHIARGLTLNDYIRTVGYKSFGAGKIYHYRNYRPEEFDQVVFPADDTLPNHPANRRPGPFGYRMFTEEAPKEEFNEQRKEGELVDSKSVEWCAERLRTTTDPFLLICGIHRPHTPWDIPKKYFDMFPPDSIQLPEVTEDDLADVPAMGKEFATKNLSETQHDKVVKAGLWKDRVRAYLANVAYMDAKVGELLDALEKSPNKDNTAICFVGDHGWHLGEKEHWAKSTLWNESVRTPLIWVVPGMTPAGAVCEKGVDMMSIYPTICELTGAPRPKHVEGLSLVPLLKDPKAKWDTPGVSTILKGNHTAMDGEWRYIRYSDGTEELYNEREDPNEWTNLANKPEHADVKKRLASFLPKNDAEPVVETAPHGSVGPAARAGGKGGRRANANRRGANDRGTTSAGALAEGDDE